MDFVLHREIDRRVTRAEARIFFAHKVFGVPPAPREDQRRPASSSQLPIGKETI